MGPPNEVNPSLRNALNTVKADSPFFIAFEAPLSIVDIENRYDSTAIRIFV
jgi:hypothetical protein